MNGVVLLTLGADKNLKKKMEQKHVLTCGSGESESSSGSHTLSEVEEEKTTAMLDIIRVSGDGDDCHNSDCGSVNQVEGDRNAECYDKETPGDEESEEDEDEKVNTAV